MTYDASSQFGMCGWFMCARIFFFSVIPAIFINRFIARIIEALFIADCECGLNFG